MTYRELLKQLKMMSDEQLDLTVTLKFEAPLADDPEFYELDIEPLDPEDSEFHLGGPEGVPHPVLVHPNLEERRLVRIEGGRMVDLSGNPVGFKDEYVQR
jgi:hypothetical protein